MAITKSIGAAGDYTTITLWSDYVKAKTGSFTDHEIGQLIDDAVYTAAEESTALDFGVIDTGAFSITLEAESSVKHDGDFGNGARIEYSASFGGMFSTVRGVTINDISFVNTEATAGGAKCFAAMGNGVLNRCLFKSNSTGSNSQAVAASSGSFNACRFEGIFGGVLLSSSSATDLFNCSVIGVTTGIDAAGAHSGTIQNTLVYSATTDWAGTFSGTYTNNASEDGTHPGTSGVTISGNPFDADGYTPAASGQLDGAGVDLSITLDAANNSFAATPSIGAYEALASDAVAPNLSLPTSASITATGVTLGATTDEDNGTSHAIITASGDQSLPTNQEIIDTGAAEELFNLVDKTISGTGAYTHTAKTGLTPNTAYGYAIVHEDTAGNEDAGSRVEGTFSTLAITAASGGTAAGVAEATIVDTGGTITITLTNDTFIAAGTGPIGTTAQSNTFVNAITSAQAEAGGWNATVRDVLDNTDLVRTSSTVATLTVPATAGYAITATETITPVVQAAILTLSTVDITASSFSIIAASTGVGAAIGVQQMQLIRKRRKQRKHNKNDQDEDVRKAIDILGKL